MARTSLPLFRRNEAADIFEDMGALYNPCGDGDCPGVLVPAEDFVYCTESLVVKPAWDQWEQGGEG